MTIEWISGEEVTIKPKSEVWQPETNRVSLRIGIYGEYSGVFGSGRFGIKALDNSELGRTYGLYGGGVATTRCVRS